MLKLTDIEDREIIVQKYKDYYFIGRFNNTKGDVYFYNYLHISNRGGNPFYTSYKTRAGHNSDIRKPSLEELHWFLECEKAGKFISKEEALKTFNKIPEYVELTEYLKSEKVFTIGKIYKINEAGLTSDRNFTHSKDDLKWLFEKYYKFKPSTKEAYEAQFKQEEFKVGDWVTANGKDHTKNNPNFPLNQAFRIEKFTANGDKKNYYAYVDKKVSKILGHSTNVHDLRKAKLEEIPTDKLTDDELLELAKEHYPVGTTFKGSYGYDCNKELPVTMHKANDCGIYSGNSYIYHKNHGWATIVCQPEPVVQKFVEPFNVYYGDIKWADYVRGVVSDSFRVEIKDPNEINIPKVVKSVKKLDLNIEKPTFAEIKIPIQERPRKVIKPIIVEKFELNF